MAVFLNGNVYINLGLPYNHVYPVPRVRSLDISDLLQLSIAADTADLHALSPLADGASSNYAVRITEHAWSIVGHGGEQFTNVIRPASQAFKASKDPAPCMAVTCVSTIMDHRMFGFCVRSSPM